MAKAADIVVEKGRQIAAELLEAGEGDIAYEKGSFLVTGTDRRIGLFEVAKSAVEMASSGKIEESLDTRAEETMPWAYPNGCHIAEIEIEPDTGIVSIARYTAIDDCGNVLYLDCRSGSDWIQVWQYSEDYGDFTGTVADIEVDSCAGDAAARLRFRATGTLCSYGVDYWRVDTLVLEAH